MSDGNYNYGRGTQPQFYGDTYTDLEVTLHRLRREANDASKAAWALEMLLWDARRASTPEERAYAADRLREYRRKHDVSYGGTSAGDYNVLVAIGWDVV
jgi:hypothetical protein